MGYSPWGHKESDTTEANNTFTFHFSWLVYKVAFHSKVIQLYLHTYIYIYVFFLLQIITK